MEQQPQTTALRVGLTATAISSKQWWRSKTLVTNALGALAMTISYAMHLKFIKDYAEGLGLLAFMVNIGLRMITNQGLIFNPEVTSTVAIQPETAVTVEPVGKG